MDAAVAPGVFEGEVLLVDESLKGWFDLFGVAGFFFLQEVVDDEALLGFSEPEVVSKFNFCSAFSALDDLNVTVVEAEELFVVGEFSPADDAFVGLFYRGGKLVEDALDTGGDLCDLTFFELGLVGVGGEVLEVVPGVSRNSFGEFLHFT